MTVAKQIALETIRKLAEAELARVHGHASADYVLGYQRCAKAIVEEIEKVGELGPHDRRKEDFISIGEAANQVVAKLRECM